MLTSSRLTAVVFVAAMHAWPAAAQAVKPNIAPPEAATAQFQYSIVYTGRMFGYFRFPAEQDDTMRRCSAVTEPVSGPAGTFEREVKKLATPYPEIRVAVGDNFAPFVLAREMGRGGGYVTKDLLAFDDSSSNPSMHKWIMAKNLPNVLAGRLRDGRATIAFDNVACFLRLVRFDALVPGKHDFYFGAERLRQLATLLATPLDAQPAPGSKQFTPVQMLAANLSIATKDNKRTPLQGEAVPHKKYESKSGWAVAGAEPVLPDVVLPWMRQIKVTGALKVARVHDAHGVTSADDLDDLLRTDFSSAELSRVFALYEGTVTISDVNGLQYDLVSNVAAATLCETQPDKPSVLKTLPGACPRLELIVPPIKDKGKLLLSRTYRIAPAGPDPEFALAPGTNRAVCLFAKRDLSGSPYCKPFSVHQPFFEPPAPVAAAPSGCAASTNGRAVPYVLKPGLHGECIAIFGVVDPNLREYVGALNDTWVSKPTADGGTEPKLEKQWETDVEVSDPVEALTQLIQFCDVEPACSKARKVLLAHMPRAKAAQIAARFATGEFDAVIAQTDYERASGNLTLTKTVHLDGDGGVDGIAEPIVLVPGAHMKVGDADTLRVRLQQTTIAIYPDHAANQHSELRIAKNTAVAAADERLDPWPAHLTVPALGDPLMTLIEKTAFAAPLRPDPAQPAAPKRSAKMTLLENLALLTMRASCRADAAILQHRDVFLSAAIDRRPLDPAALRLALDMVFWKGDFVVCRTLTGATIKQLLARSAEVAALEANGVVTDLEFGRGLAVLGVKKDLDSGDYVIDGQFIDDKKIYSVATTDFVTEGDTGYAPLQAADPKPPLMGELEHLTRLSALIAQRLGAPQPDVRIDAADYLDASSRAPFDRTGDGVWRQSGRWWVNFLLPNRPIAKATALESSSQQHPLLAISLESLDLKYSDYRHTPHGEKSVNDQFGGAGISELLAPATVDLGYDAQFRVKQSSRWTDLYSFTELHRLRHSEHLLEDPDPATKVTQAANQISQEFGVLVNALPWARRNPSSYKILAAYRRDAVIDDPFQNLKLTDPTNTEKTGPMIYPVPVPKPLTRYAKLGLRHQFRDSALEGGILLGQKLHSVSQFNLSGHRPGGTDPLPCPVDVTRSLQKCADDAMMQTYTGSTTALVDHAQNGYFFNSRIHVPLPLGTTKFLSDQKWQLFRNNDQDVDLDTRYLLRWKLSIELPVFGNLSFAPSWEVLHFRNKQHPRSFNSRRTSLELKYNFDWHSGMGLKALVYPSPAPPQ